MKTAHHMYRPWTCLYNYKTRRLSYKLIIILCMCTCTPAFKNNLAFSLVLMTSLISCILFRPLLHSWDVSLIPVMVVYLYTKNMWTSINLITFVHTVICMISFHHQIKMSVPHFESQSSLWDFFGTGRRHRRKTPSGQQLPFQPNPECIWVCYGGVFFTLWSGERATCKGLIL